ncbi:MAG: hypothetical protein ABEL51_05120 [Salinibacter sp.]
MPLRWIGVLAGLLLVLGGASAQAQSPADAFFHDAAQRYVDGNLAGARQAVERGLEVAPSDPRLQALRKKLKQQRKKRGGGGRSSRNGEQSQSQDQRSRGQQSQKQRSGKAGDKSRPRADRSSDQRSSRSSGNSDGRSESASKRRTSEGGQKDGRRSNALSRAQAARLLRALERQEMRLLREVQARGRPSKSATVAKDW